MASIANDPGGRRRIQFTNSANQRKTIRLGKVSQRAAESVRVHVENLVVASILRRAVEDETARWVSELDAVMLKKLVRVGLIAPPEDKVAEPRTPTLAAFIDEYTRQRIDVKPGTAEIYKQIRRNLVDFLGADTPIGHISAGDAEDFRLDLIGQKLAEATVRRRCGLAKQLFRKAVKKRLIDSNPFEDIVCTSRRNRDRFYFVTRTEINAVIEACPDAQWKLLIALSRYGGLRCPSEHLSLRWGDIDWEKNRIRVPSPKAEHHEGKAERIIPLFPELLPYLQTVFEEAEAGAEYVITRYRSSRANLRTHFQRIIRKAGLTPWPKPWQNLRSTRQTELAETFPAHVVCRWIGNTLEVADEHYLQVTDDHYQRAIDNQTGLSETAQNPAQNAQEPKGTAVPVGSANREDDTNNAVGACSARSGTGPQGFEP